MLLRALNRMSLTSKLVVSFAIIYVIAVASASALFISSGRTAMIQSLETHAEIMVLPLVTALGDGLATSDAVRVQKLLDETKKADSAIVYAIALNAKGSAFGSTDPGLKNQVLLRHDFEKTMFGVENVTRRPVPGEAHQFEVAAPVQYPVLGKIGVLRIGFSTSQLESAWRRTTWIVAGISAVALLAGLLIYVWIARLVARPLHATAERLEELATGEADLTHRLEVNSRDDIGRLATAFNTFLDKLHDLIQQLVASSGRVASASEELAVSSRHMAEGAQEQTEKTTHVAAAMQEMAATVIEVNRNADEVTRAARSAAEVATKGQEIVSKNVAGMRGIAQKVNESASLIENLGKQSNQIGEIIEVIDDIADQTNLLALNAAIEAARAGEQGRGFAVVADEVRKLAERTGRATKEIEGMIKAIQGQTGVVVSNMAERRAEVENGLDLATRAGESLREIVQVVDRVLGQVERIASATQQQSASTEEVSSHVETVATIARQTASGAGTTAQATHELSKLALEMQRMLGRFGLKEHHARRFD